MSQSVKQGITVDLFPHILANAVDIQKVHLLLHTPLLNNTRRLSSRRMFVRLHRLLLIHCIYVSVTKSTDCNPGVASSIPARSHTFVEIDHEIISTVILLPSADSFQEGLLSVTSESMCTNYWLTACSSLPRKKVWLGELTVPQ